MSHNDLLDVDRLARELRAAAEPLRADPYLAARAVRGGGRRLTRRRRRTVGGIGLTLAVIAVTVSALGNGALDLRRDARPDPADKQRSSRSQPYDSYEDLSRRPTTGTLARDEPYLFEARRLWLDFLRPENLPPYTFTEYDEAQPVGSPHVVWAGATSVGRAAMLVQQVALHDTADVMPADDAVLWVAAFLGVDDKGGTRIAGLGVEYPGWSGPLWSAWYVDTARTNIAVVDPGVDVRWSKGLDYLDDGSTQSMPFRPVDFTDGAASLGADPALDPFGVRVEADGGSILLPTRDSLDAVVFAGRSFVSKPSQVDGMATVSWSKIKARANAVRARAAGFGPDVPEVTDHDWRWLTMGREPDGADVLVFVQDYGTAWPHVYVVRLGPDGDSLQHVGPAPASVKDPISVPLPDGSGTIEILKRGELRYREPDGTWTAWIPGQLAKANAAGVTESRWTG